MYNDSLEIQCNNAQGENIWLVESMRETRKEYAV